MNERIQELALEAGDYVNEVYTPPVRSKTPGKIWEDGHIDWLTQFNEKFAELILEECRTVINDVYHKTPLELCGPLLTADEEIMNHFYEVEKLT